MRLTLGKLLLIVIGLLYVLSPWDILPDFLGLLGRVDDLILIGLVYWKYRDLTRRADQYAAQMYAEQQDQDSQRENEQADREQADLDPYEVFEIESDTSWEEIEKQHRVLMSKYHPDKVNHLGEELQKAAHNKSVEIQQAYEKLRALHER